MVGNQKPSFFMKDSIASRMDFDVAVELFAKAFRKSKEQVVKDFRLTQSRLRLEQPITTTSTLLSFPVLSNIQNQAQQFNTEVRLNLQDSFIPTRIGIYVAKPTGTADATFKLQSYMNPFVFAQAVPMQVLYNGFLSISVNNDKLLPNWPLGWHESRPETQQTAAVGAGSPVDQFNGDDDGLRPMQPFVLLLGSKNLQIQVNLPLAPTAVDANSRMVIVFDGILAQNSTVVS